MAINGSDIAHCEEKVKEALMWVDVSFIRCDRGIKIYIDSKALDTTVNKAAKVPFTLYSLYIIE